MLPPLPPRKPLVLPPLSPWRRYPRYLPQDCRVYRVRWPGQDATCPAYWDGAQWLTVQQGAWAPCTIRNLQLEWDSRQPTNS